MNTMIKTHITKIGNSQAIRIPKFVFDQLGWGKEVQLEVKSNCLVIWANSSARAGWEEQFRQMAACGDDQLLDQDLTSTNWDETEWEW